MITSQYEAMTDRRVASLWKKRSRRGGSIPDVSGGQRHMKGVIRYFSFGDSLLSCRRKIENIRDEYFILQLTS